MLSASLNRQKRFVRRPNLMRNEYHKNFYKLDREIMTWVTSPEADKVTPLMGKIYLRMANAPVRYFEREGVLRFEAEVRDGKQRKAWDVLREVLGVASATAHKALTWLHEEGVIGYFAGKNGVGIRIFLNRAISSIGVRPEVAPGSELKILPQAHASFAHSPVSTNETASNDSFAVKETLDNDLDPPAPKNGANQPDCVSHSKLTALDASPTSAAQRSSSENVSAVNAKDLPIGVSARSSADSWNKFTLDEITRHLQSVLEPSLRAAAIKASREEYERTREWLEKSGIPKAVRVAQRESYDVLRAHGLVEGKRGGTKFKDEVGRSQSEVRMVDSGAQTPAQKQLSEVEVLELAEACIALQTTQGKPIEVTLQEITCWGVSRKSGVNSNDGGKHTGGWLAATDAERVRSVANKLISLSGGQTST